MMASQPLLPEMQELHSRVFDILAIKSVLSYSRALSVIEKVVEDIGTVSQDADKISPLATGLLRNCRFYEDLCRRGIQELVTQESVHERDTYSRRAKKRSASTSSDDSSSRSNVCSDNYDEGAPRRRGVLFEVDNGEHIVEALEALRLEGFLVQQRDEPKGKDSRMVRWADKEGKAI